MTVILGAALAVALLFCAGLFLRNRRRRLTQLLSGSRRLLIAALVLTALLGFAFALTLTKGGGGRTKTPSGRLAARPAVSARVRTTAKSKPAATKKRQPVHRVKPVKVRPKRRLKPRPKPKPKRPRVVTVTTVQKVPVYVPPKTTTSSSPPVLKPDPAPPQPPRKTTPKPKPRPKPKPKPRVFGFVTVRVSLQGGCGGTVPIRIFHLKGGYAVRNIAACQPVRVTGVRLGDNICQVIRPPRQLSPLSPVCQEVLAFRTEMVFSQVLPAAAPASQSPG